MTKKHFEAYNRQANAVNSVNRNIADLQAYVNYLSQTRDVDELEKLNSQLSSFLSEVKSNYLNSLPTDESYCKEDAVERS